METKRRGNKRKVDQRDHLNSSQEAALDLSSQSSVLSSASSASSSGSQSPTSSVSSLDGSQKSFAKFNRSMVSKLSDEYKEKRARNNEAVKKSREKSRLKLESTLANINQLSETNQRLMRDVDILTKECKLIRCMYQSHLRHAHNIILADDELITKEDADRLNIHL